MAQTYWDSQKRETCIPQQILGLVLPILNKNWTCIVSIPICLVFLEPLYPRSTPAAADGLAPAVGKPWSSHNVDITSTLCAGHHARQPPTCWSMKVPGILNNNTYIYSPGLCPGRVRSRSSRQGNHNNNLLGHPWRHYSKHVPKSAPKVVPRLQKCLQKGSQSGKSESQVLENSRK